MPAGSYRQSYWDYDPVATLYVHVGYCHITYNVLSNYCITCNRWLAAQPCNMIYLGYHGDGTCYSSSFHQLGMTIKANRNIEQSLVDSCRCPPTWHGVHSRNMSRFSKDRPGTTMSTSCPSQDSIASSDLFDDCSSGKAVVELLTEASWPSHAPPPLTRIDIMKYIMTIMTGTPKMSEKRKEFLHLMK